MIYIIVFFISVMCLEIAQKNRFRGIGAKIFVIIALIVPSTLAGLRDYSIGGDISAYGNYWFKRACSSSNYFEFINNARSYSICYGYSTLNFLVSRFTSNPHWFYFYLCLFELVVLLLTLHDYKDRISIPFAFILYYFLYYNDSFNNMRQFPALLIVLFSFKYVKKRKPLIFALVILLASFFHETAYIAAVLYPISLLVEGKGKVAVFENNREVMNTSKGKNNNTALIIVALLSLVVSVSLERIFFTLSNIGGLNLSRYNHYFEDQDISGGKLIRLFLFTSCFAYFLVKRKTNKTNNTDMLNTLFAYSEISLFFTLALFSGASSYIVRVAYYFDYFVLIYIPLIVYKICDGKGEYEKFSNEKIQKKIIEYSIIVLVVFLYWLITYVIRNGAHTYPYVFTKE